MPTAAKRACIRAGCRQLIAYGGECPDHPKKAWRRKPGTTTQRGYGAAWRKLRTIVISRDSGLCQPCLRQGVTKAFADVDHIISKANGGTDAISNLQCICKQCHKRKTSKTDRQGGGNS